MQLDFSRDFNDAELNYLAGLSDDELDNLIDTGNSYITICDTNQQNRKIALNSAYGALGNAFFRFYDLRNASAITLFGQLAIQWIERKVNEYLNKVCGTDDYKFVIYCDTDSIYCEFSPLIDKIGIDRFKTTDDLVNFMSRFASEKMEPVINDSYIELKEYMNNKEHLMFMDREAIACPPLGSKGVGGFWTAKKRYALNVYDMEGTRYAKPKLKIMGIETQKSSTPKAVQDALKESIRRMLQEGEKSLQEYYLKFEDEYRQLPYKVIARVSSANNLEKYNDGKGYPRPKCPAHVKGALAFNRSAAGFPGVSPVRDGEKVMYLPLRDGNPFRENVISWVSGTDLPQEIRQEVLTWLDYGELFQKTFVKPLEAMTEACDMNYEVKGDLFDIFDF